MTDADRAHPETIGYACAAALLLLWDREIRQNRRHLSPPPVYYTPAPPPVYIEQPQSSAYWYYCQAYSAYYPHVRVCPGGWQRVAPQPPPG
jgi:hypothetical protein